MTLLGNKKNIKIISVSHYWISRKKEVSYVQNLWVKQAAFMVKILTTSNFLKLSLHSGVCGSVNTAFSLVNDKLWPFRQFSDNFEECTSDPSVAFIVRECATAGDTADCRRGDVTGELTYKLSCNYKNKIELVIKTYFFFIEILFLR